MAATFLLLELPRKRHGGWRCPAIIVQKRISDECNCLESGDRWVAIQMQTPKRVLISAHLPTIKSLWKISSLHDFEQIRTEAFGLRRYTGNAGEHQRTPRWSDFEDGWHVGPCTKPAKLTSGEQERASSFTEFSTRTGLVLANTWSRGKMIGEATKKPWHKSDLLGHTDEDSDTQVVAVKPSSCVQRKL